MDESSNAPGAADGQAPRIFLMLCGVGMFAILSSTMSKSPVLPLFARSLGVTNAMLGLVAAASTIVGIIVSMPAGALSDILGRRAVLLTALFVFATAPVGYLFVHTAGSLVVVRVYHGLATAIFGPVAMAYVADLTRARRGEKMSWYSTATLVGRSIAPVLGGVLILLSYHTVYIACAAAGFLALALSFGLPKAAKPDAPPPASRQGMLRQIGEGLVAVGRSRIILVTSTVEAMQYLAYGAFETFLPLYVQDQGISKWQIGIILGAQIATLALTKPLSGRTSDRLGRRPVIVAGLAMNALALVGLTLYPHFWGFLISSALFGLAMSMVTASTSALVADVSRARHYGTSLGVLSSIMDVGHASGPIIAGFVIGALAYDGTYRALAALVVVAMLVFVALTGNVEREIGAAVEADGEALP